MDWNNDGKKDLLVGDYYGNLRWFKNVGTNRKPVFTNDVLIMAGAAAFDAGDYAAPEVVDWDADGKKDLLCGALDGTVKVLRNIGTDAAPAFGATAATLNSGASPLSAGAYSHPVAVDWDADGKKDLLVGSYDGTVQFYRNVGTDAAPVFNGYATLKAEGATLNVGNVARPEVADLDGDGLNDLVVGNWAGGAIFYHAIKPGCPWFKLGPVVINDAGGNTNGVPDPGENAFILVTISNLMAGASNVVAILQADPPGPAPHISQVSFGNIASNGYKRNASNPYCLRVPQGSAQQGMRGFKLDVSYGGGPTWQTLPFTIGEYWTSNSVPMSWIDTSGGTTVPLGDEAISSPIAMPFTFPFFAATYTSFRIDDNGYLIFGAADNQYSNSPLPDPGLPNGIVAPFWDDLDTSSGTVRYRFGGAAPNRYGVVEWNSVPLWSFGGSLTFQVALYEDGSIRFQYGALSGTNSTGNSATIGIEDPSGGRGIQVSYGLPGAVANGRAIRFQFARKATDTDGDRIPDALERFCFGNLGQTAAGDFDSDGVCNGAELRAGTAPSDPRSSLRIIGVADSGGTNVVIRWRSVPGCPYRLERCASLGAPAWSNACPLPIEGNPSGENVCTAGVDKASSPRFFRIRVP